jgi:hypothetical protein
MAGRTKQETPRMGRPPRTDDPTRVDLLLPGEVRRWLEIQARREDRAQGDVVASALMLYRQHAARRKP